MQSVDLQPSQTSEPEAYTFDVELQGTGAAAPTVTVGKGITVTRSSAGALLLSFARDPGPTFLGGAGGGFGNATATNVAGWSAVFGAFTKVANGAPATLAVTICNASNAAADLATTSNVYLGLRFKMGSLKE